MQRLSPFHGFGFVTTNETNQYQALCYEFVTGVGLQKGSGKICRTKNPDLLAPPAPWRSPAKHPEGHIMNPFRSCQPTAKERTTGTRPHEWRGGWLEARSGPDNTARATSMDMSAVPEAPGSGGGGGWWHPAPSGGP